MHTVNFTLPHLYSLKEKLGGWNSLPVRCVKRVVSIDIFEGFISLPMGIVLGVATH